MVCVERLENAQLWQRYEACAQSEHARPSKSHCVQETCRPIRCDLSENECYLFHGTKADSVPSILRDGFDLGLAADRGGRYGDGVYFSDASCKAHQYTEFGELACGGKVYCMLYCRVVLGTTMRFNATNAAAKRGYLSGMKRPMPGDPVFESQVLASGGKAKARTAWDSVAVLGGADTQVHREYVCFRSEQIYPEYVVYYRLDSEGEEAALREQYQREMQAKMDALMKQQEEMKKMHIESLRIRTEMRSRFMIQAVSAGYKRRTMIMKLLLDESDEEEERFVDFTPDIRRPD